MRIRSITIGRWRNFEDITLRLSESAGIVCLVGANGTGKSHLLELLSACAHHFGLSAGIEIPRGNPFTDEHSFSVEIYLAENVSEALDQPFGENEDYEAWDRTLTVVSETGVGTHIEAGGIVDTDRRRSFGQQVVQILNRTQEVHHLSLDADRAYPKRDIPIHEIAQAYGYDWRTPQWTRDRSFRPSRTLYDEWTKFFLATENQAGTRLLQGIRRARQMGQAEPQFEDHFAAFKSDLQKVLPHLEFTGVDADNRTLVFDTTGMQLSFDQLSGGEREIAFLIGQIDRFRLLNGLFLLDEPELHLNADLIRTWIGYLNGTISKGQIWLATHSLEVAEAAGQDATFILERNEATKKVDSVTRFSDRPVLSALSRAVGTPAFSLSQLCFVFVEGEDGLGERERFRSICGDVTGSRFIVCGSCNEVVRRVSAINSLATEANQGIRVGGIIDRDWRSTKDAKDYGANHDVFVLPVHEVENLFLHPETLRHILAQNGKDPAQGRMLVRSASDHRAGGWIYQRARAIPQLRALPEPHSEARRTAFELSWDDISIGIREAMTSIADAEETLDPDQRARLLRTLEVCARMYRRIRERDDLWKYCEGKENFRFIAPHLGFSDAQAAERAILVSWSSDENLLSEEVRQIRGYINAL